jgi:hypothetical protein
MKDSLSGAILPDKMMEILSYHLINLPLAEFVNKFAAIHNI